MRAWVEARSAEWAARCELENAMIRSAGGYDWWMLNRIASALV